jgi:hypothetical protein
MIKKISIKINDQEAMPLDEAIQHCLENCKNYENCDPCQTEHIQLADWLIELKKLRQENRKYKELYGDL